MSYIQPNGNIIICDVDSYTPDLSDAPLFYTQTDQYNWFYRHAILQLSNQSYTRRTNNVLRIQAPIKNLYRANYLMFKNGGFEDKWYYAFITKVEYINNNTCEILFTIDPMQTWFTLDQATIGECYVLREHVVDDTIGTNLEPEPVQTGEMMAEPNSYNHLGGDYCEPCIILATSEPSDSHQAGGGRINNTYSGCILTAWDFGHIDGLNGTIAGYASAGKPDAIVGMWMAPKGAVGGSNFNGQLIWQTATNHSVEARGNDLTANSGFRYWDNEHYSMQTWHPKNNKLYTYPYTFYRVMTGQGNYADYRYEFFQNARNSHSPRFRIIGNVLQPITVMCSPINYKGRICNNYEMPNGDIITENMPYWAESLSVTGFPQCSWSNDTYAAWMAQNSVPMANVKHALEATNDNNLNTLYGVNKNKLAQTNIQTISSMLQGLIGGFLGNPMTGIAGSPAGAIAGTANAGIQGITNYLNQEISNSNSEAVMKNAINNSEINLVTSQQNSTYRASLLADTMGGTINSGSNTLGDTSSNFGSAMSFFGFRMMPNIHRLQKIDRYFDMFGYAVNTVKIPNLTARKHWNYVKTVNASVNGHMPAEDRQNIKDLFDRGIRLWITPDQMGQYDLDNSPS